MWLRPLLEPKVAVATWSGFAYVAFVTDVYSRRIVGRNVASTLKAEILPLHALNMAAWAADGNLDGLLHHADHGSNYLAVVYTERIEELGAKPVDRLCRGLPDNAMAEAVNGLYKTELIRRRGPWRTTEQVELATLEYVWWWNNARLHGELDTRTPIQVEQAYYADQESGRAATARQETGEERKPDRITPGYASPTSHTPRKGVTSSGYVNIGGALYSVTRIPRDGAASRRPQVS